MDLALTEAEYQALPQERQNGEQQDDGSYRIVLESDPWIQIDAATSERDAIINERDTFRRERDEARDEVRDLESKRPGLNRSIEEYRIHGTPDEFATVKRRVADMPTPEDPKMVEMQTQLDSMKKEREEERAARERAEAARVADHRRAQIRETVTKRGVHPELIGMYVLDLERRGVSEEAGRLYLGPEGNRKTVDDVITEDTGGARKILLAKTVTLPGEDGKPGTPINLDPDGVTLDGDPAQRQAALDKLAGDLYPNVVSRATGQQQK